MNMRLLNCDVALVPSQLGCLQVLGFFNKSLQECSRSDDLLDTVRTTVVTPPPILPSCPMIYTPLFHARSWVEILQKFSK